jgi:uncharacterized UBP type Zn finger protein
MYLVCEWNPDFLEKFSEPNCLKWQDHSSVASVPKDLDTPRDIQECLEMFSKGDELQVTCDKCKQV